MREGLEQKCLLLPGSRGHSWPLLGCKGKALLGGLGKENSSLQPLELPKIAFNANTSKYKAHIINMKP